MKKRILYVLTSPAHKRVFESFVERSDMEQRVIGPAPAISHFVPEDYSDFKLKNITYLNSGNIVEEISKLVSEFKPNVYVQADLTKVHTKIFGNFKKVYASHGMVGNHVINIIKQANLDTSVWKGMDLYCGASPVFSGWIRHVAKVDDSKILLDALPQLDIIHNSEYFNSYKDKILSKTKYPSPKKVILFIGFCGKDRVDFKEHNEDFFKTAIELGKIAKQNDWLILIKPRQEHRRIVEFLQNQKWRKLYELDYNKLLINPNVHFITAANAHIYRYFFADAFVINGCSTAEIEACAIQKPLFIVRTHPSTLKNKYDPYNTITSGAAIHIVDTSKLEHYLYNCFEKNKYYRQDRQKQLLEDMKISFDGRHHERIQNKLMEL